MTGLFRQDFFQSRRTPFLGKPAIAQPVSLWILVGLAALIAISVIIFLAVAKIPARVVVQGYVAPEGGLIWMAAPLDGALSEVLVSEGQVVPRGAPLFRTERSQAPKGQSSELSDALDALEARALAEAERLERERQALSELDGSLFEKLQQARRVVDAAQSEVELRTRQVAVREQAVERFRQIAQSQFVSVLQVQEQETILLESRAMLEAARRTLAASSTELAAIRQDIARAPLQIASIEADLAKIESELASSRVSLRQDSVALTTASEPYEVVAVLGRENQSVRKGERVMALAPAEAPKAVHLLVPSSASGELKPGDRVSVRVRAYPHRRFGSLTGSILAISPSAGALEEMSNGFLKGSSEDSFLRVEVRLAQDGRSSTGAALELKHGMTLEADISGAPQYVWDALFSRAR